jgi:WD40 repeat protein
MWRRAQQYMLVRRLATTMEPEKWNANYRHLNGKTSASGSEDWTVRLWDIEMGAMSCPFGVAKSSQNGQDKASFNRDSVA